VNELKASGANNTNNIPIRRNFDTKLNASGKLFNGQQKSNYDKHLMKDDTMQKIVLRDQ